VQGGQVQGRPGQPGSGLPGGVSAQVTEPVRVASGSSASGRHRPVAGPSHPWYEECPGLAGPNHLESSMNPNTPALLLLLAGTACATAGAPSKLPPPSEFRAADGTLVVCTMESSTGTHIRERVCRRVEGSTPNDKQNVETFLRPQPVNTRTGQ